ncbi:MAG: hypothetical protein GYA46_00530 [candidate division Zixibacteria bacterium]|nr:hypothetical protein [candidate division Zixibacteria bacterium]
MIRELGVERLAKDGIIIVYRHPAIAEIHGGDDSFVVHVIHGKRREMIYRKNFLEYLYKRLREIIDQTEVEARDV